MKPEIMPTRLWLFLFMAAVLFSCKKEEQVVFTDNDIPPYSEIPTLLVENYVNRLYIDLIGREPTDAEMAADVAALEAADLSMAVRIALVQFLTGSEEAASADETYKSAYFRKFYEDQKARFLDGIGEGALMDDYNVFRGLAVTDSIQGNILGYEIFMLEANKLMAVMDSRIDLQNGTITVDEMCRRMMFNSIYDEINMNTFNFINASFDDSFFRFPTETELENAFPTIEFNGPGVLFGQSISTKSDYLLILTTSSEFREGMIRWCYRNLLARDAESFEVVALLPVFNNGFDTKLVQQHILISDEYAGFD
ncbi:MAG: hypothetical protein ACK500_07275 [Flavobacteriales bacterium]